MVHHGLVQKPRRGLVRDRSTTWESDHAKIGEPYEAEGKDEPEEVGDQACSGQRDGSELIHFVIFP